MLPSAGYLDDLERAIDDGVNVIKALMKDSRLVPGAGASELELARRVETYGSGLKGLAQHAVKRYATALEVVPRTLAENALGGAEGNEVLSRLWAKHEETGGEAWGVDIEVHSLRPHATYLQMLTRHVGGNRWPPPGDRTQNHRLVSVKVVGDKIGH